MFTFSKKDTRAEYSIQSHWNPKLGPIRPITHKYCKTSHKISNFQFATSIYEFFVFLFALCDLLGLLICLKIHKSVRVYSVILT